ncbi:MAG: MFS transporter [Gammaproteobacteria bacterium]|nr:MFS transporter [Gammaproteobacteria bacterium]
MSPLELRASFSLASIYGLRMLGMFLILPVFALYAEELPGGRDHTMIGLALGAYGLTQALFQLPFGMASDRLGRKRVIYFGLLLFALGSFIAATAHDINMIILGRVIQGAGAINAAVTALLADLTREEHRTKAMAMIGGTIGMTFALSLVLGPALYHWISIPGIFAMTGVLALLALLVVKFSVPDPRASHFHSDAQAAPAKLRGVLHDRELLRLNFGVFALHAAQMAMFVVVPFALRETGGLDVNHHWQVYLPVLLISFLIMLPPIIYGEKKAKMKQVFVGAILLMLLAEIFFARAITHFEGIVAVLTFYFVAFNILEASLPSLVSKIAPVGAKGTAMGVYNTCQSLGLFVGGVLGGVLSHRFGAAAVFEFSAVLMAIWLFLAYGMKALPAVKNLMFPLPMLSSEETKRLQEKILQLAGVQEVTVIPEEQVVYIKVNRQHLDEQALQKLLPSVS